MISIWTPQNKVRTTLLLKAIKNFSFLCDAHPRATRRRLQPWPLPPPIPARRHAAIGATPPTSLGTTQGGLQGWRRRGPWSPLVVEPVCRGGSRSGVGRRGGGRSAVVEHMWVGAISDSDARWPDRMRGKRWWLSDPDVWSWSVGGGRIPSSLAQALSPLSPCGGTASSRWSSGRSGSPRRWCGALLCGVRGDVCWGRFSGRYARPFGTTALLVPWWGG
jgi:hypothetical protein